jgi:hypothetical protein
MVSDDVCFFASLALVNWYIKLFLGIPSNDRLLKLKKAAASRAFKRIGRIERGEVRAKCGYITLFI